MHLKSILKHSVAATYSCVQKVKLANFCRKSHPLSFLTIFDLRDIFVILHSVFLVRFGDYIVIRILGLL